MKIVVGMSGGVDSAVTALLLKRQGHEVIGVFMKNWDEKDEGGNCLSDEDYIDVCRDCDKIGIPYYTVNFTEQYRQRVFAEFLEEYAAGRTPNPDVLCNREIKFGAFLDYVDALDADALATGHYARLEQKDGVFHLLKGSYDAKEQSYFLYMLNQKQLSRAMFPIGGMDKPEVRRIAAEAGLVAAKKKDSTGVCFIGERNFKKFLMQYLPISQGDMVDTEGKVVGRHDGLCYYTLGQRRGLGIPARDGGGRWFVIGKDAEKNQLMVRQGDGPELYSDGCRVIKTTFINGSPAGEFECAAKFRYRQRDVKVRVRLDENGCGVTFFEPQRAVTPGQSAVFYMGEECIGGGIIESSYKE